MDRDALLERVLSFAGDSEWAGALELLQNHVESLDDDPAVHCWLGVVEHELGNGGAAYECFKRALSLQPEDPYILTTAGNGLAYFDDPDAEQALRAAALTAPQVAVGRLMYGAYLAREGFHEDAVRELSAARDIDPDDSQIAYELGVTHALVEKYDEATDAFADAVRLAPEDGWVRVVFGLALLEVDRFDEATGELMSGARLSETDLDAQLAAALCAAATQRDDIAYEMLERARMNAIEGDLALVTAVEDRLEGGVEAATSMLTEDLAPNMLRMRLRERP